MPTTKIKKEDSRMQKLVIALSISSFIMFVIVLVLSCYVLKYSLGRKVIYNDFQKEKVDFIKNEAKPKTEQEVIEEKIFLPEELSVEEVVKMVSKHMLLVDGDVTVASVTNIDGLRTDYPDLFQYAKNGDKLLFYQLGIIIYDPILDKIVDVMRRLPDGTYIPNSPFEEN